MDSQYKIIHPVKYLQGHLSQGVRPDGRQFLSFRPISINIKSITHADSSAVYKIGNTTVVCGIKAELTQPKPDAPDIGYVIPNVDLSPLCSPKFKPGPPSEQAQITSRMVDEILRNSAPINSKDLCIQKDKLVWVLYCDLICINYDGSVIDACIGALIAALKILTLPKVSYNPETGSIEVFTDNRMSLPMKALPVSTTFAVFENQLLVVDPTDEEEDLSLGKISIVVDRDEVCYVHKPGGIPVSQDLFLTALEKSKRRAEMVESLIDATISSLNSPGG